MIQGQQQKYFPFFLWYGNNGNCYEQVPLCVHSNLVLCMYTEKCYTLSTCVLNLYKIKIFVFVEVEVSTCYQFANYLFMMDIIHCHKDATYLQTTNRLFRHFSFLKYIRQTSNIFRPKRKNCRKSYPLLVVVVYFFFQM